MVSLIVAASDNDVIGHLNGLPWYLPRDLKNFKALTTGHTCIMGRKTFESIMARLGKPLPDRTSIIITHQIGFHAPAGVIVAGSWKESMRHVAAEEEVFVSGGEAIYAMALPHADRIYLTRVHMQVEGDVKLPIADFSDWNLVHEEEWLKDEKNPVDATYHIYERKR